MPRKPQSARPERRELTEPEKHLLLTGDPAMKPGRYEGWLKPFQLVSPVGRKDLTRLWLEHRDAILAEWREQGRKGLPWAAREFD